MGAKDRTGIESFLFGNVAEKVAHHAMCSVLIGRTQM
ncbi:MAG: universal stress protein [Dehalococcoidia bacterium]|nr:universal stress protein [Dehalococcoidia bacterium]